MASTTETVIISARGELRALYSPQIEKLAAAIHGDVRVRRASFVDPSADLREAAWEYLLQHRPEIVETASAQTGWFVDLLPVHGPVLGPFETRDAALTAERDWLLSHDIPCSYRI